jgi:hypothetical protein
MDDRRSIRGRELDCQAIPLDPVRRSPFIRHSEAEAEISCRDSPHVAEDDLVSDKYRSAGLPL